MATFRIATLEARLENELARLVERHGGDVLRAPAVRELPAVDLGRLTAFLELLAAGRVAVVIVQTGVGAQALFTASRELGHESALRAGLAAALVVARGPKPLAVLRAAGVRVDLQAPAPYTTTEVLSVLDRVSLAGRQIVLTQYGASNSALVEALGQRGAQPLELPLYRWVLPDDLTPLYRLLGALQRNELDAILFTSQVQVQHLFQVAELIGHADELGTWLDATCVGAVGPVVAQALAQRDVRVSVQPDNPKMGPLVLATLGRLTHDDLGAKGLSGTDLESISADSPAAGPPVSATR